MKPTAKPGGLVTDTRSPSDRQPREHEVFVISGESDGKPELTSVMAAYPRDFYIVVGGRRYEHVDVNPDGTWIYRAS